MRPKILFLDQGETLGGSERFLLDYLRSFQGDELRRINPIVAGAVSGEYRQMLPAAAEKVVFSFPSVKGNIFKKIIAGTRFLKAASKIKHIAEEESVTKIFTNTPRTAFVMLVAKKLFWIKTPWIVMIHDFTIPKFLLRSIASSAHTIIVNSVPTRKYVRDCISKRDQQKIRIVENGIDFAKIPQPIRPTEIKKILVLGRIDPRKGQMYSLEAAELLEKRYPELQFFIVGSPFLGDPATMKYQKLLHEFANHRKMKNVFFIPEVQNPFDVIEESDCVLMLSTEPETFGRVTIEALALGKLVIAFDETGPKEVLTQFSQFCKIPPKSILAEKKNSMDLAEKISFFVDHPEHVQKVTLHARQFVEENYPLSDTKKHLTNVLLEK